jgi:4-hydroxybenzoate polyprenyltransferase
MALTEGGLGRPEETAKLEGAGRPEAAGRTKSGGQNRSAAGRDGLGGRLATLGESVMIRHSLFSLPFAAAAVLLETGGRPPVGKLLWILVAAFGARNSANALNRIIDARIDAANPRTAGRALPQGRVKLWELWAFAGAMLALLVLGAAMLNPLCLALLPVAGILVFGYSYTKRFTWLCHYWLGITCSGAVMGAFLGISGAFELRYFPLTAGVAFWIAGFDILYAIQDIGFDRAARLKSIPARFGEKKARSFAAASHLLALAGFASIYLYWPAAGIGLGLSLALCAILLASEHIIARKGTERHIKIAAYSINEIIPLVILAGVALDIYLL